jgi:hypothetical protein
MSSRCSFSWCFLSFSNNASAASCSSLVLRTARSLCRCSSFTVGFAGVPERRLDRLICPGEPPDSSHGRLRPVDDPGVVGFLLPLLRAGVLTTPAPQLPRFWAAAVAVAAAAAAVSETPPPLLFLIRTLRTRRASSSRSGLSNPSASTVAAASAPITSASAAATSAAEGIGFNAVPSPPSTSPAEPMAPPIVAASSASATNAAAVLLATRAPFASVK